LDEARKNPINTAQRHVQRSSQIAATRPVTSFFPLIKEFEGILEDDPSPENMTSDPKPSSNPSGNHLPSHVLQNLNRSCGPQLIIA